MFNIRVGWYVDYCDCYYWYGFDILIGVGGGSDGDIGLRCGVCMKIGDFGPKTRDFLRDGIASGRGVHRKWGYLIQKSRSNFRGSSQKSRNSGILGGWCSIVWVSAGSGAICASDVLGLRCTAGNPIGLDLRGALLAARMK